MLCALCSRWSALKEVRPVYRSILFTALLATEALHKGDRCCYTNTKDLLSMCTTDHSPGLFLFLAPSKAGWIPRSCIPIPLGKDLIALCHGLLQPLNPCVAIVYSLPQPAAATFLDVPLKDLTKGWENLRVIRNPPCLDRGRVLTPVCQWQPVPHNSVYPCSACACALVPDSCCTSLPASHSSRWREGVMFRTVWWEVGKIVSWVQFMHLRLKDC